ncbi:MAG: translation elongation factor 4 [Patescibacteria group bacterium]|nr:translation elongation factor 4 [Patescibacteria group bacterium]
MKNIRNFCIIAHIDHGKSTLADRLLELTGTVSKREMKDQLLDTMDLERERGITIKLQPARMNYKEYILNLIDTPGHVDFAYEVSRSLAAVEGALLIVDATQGIQAQTLANAYQAQEQGLTLIPIINKIDLPAADREKVAGELINTFGFKKEEMIYVSAKTGEGVEKVLEAIVERIPAPGHPMSGNSPTLDVRVVRADKPDKLRALVFDSKYDSYRGVIAFVRVFDGEVKSGEKIFLVSAKKGAEALEIGYFKPGMLESGKLLAGEIGYIVTSLKDISLVGVGDTITLEKFKEDISPLPGYKKVKPTVFAGIYPADSNDLNKLREGLSKLKMNDAALEFTGENSPVLGLGFRVGFLGMLHLDIIKERLEREFNLELIITHPTVGYEIELTNGEKIATSNPAEFPGLERTKSISEPWVTTEILLPKTFVGSVLDMLGRYRGIYREVKYIDESKALIIYEVPLAVMIKDFYDDLKSVSSGYASLNYEHIGLREGNLAKMDVLLAGDKIESLSQIVDKDEAQKAGNEIVSKLKKLIPRQMFEVSIQAAIGSRILARENMSAMKKDVAGYLYGGDRTRKDKLINKQKEGKKKMKALGRVNVPSNVFLDLMKK